jgi:hypothetical protein
MSGSFGPLLAQNNLGDVQDKPTSLTNVGALPAAGGTVTGNLTVNAHLQFGGQTPQAVAGGQAGSSPPSPVMTTGSNDGAGNVTFGSGTGPTTGTQVAVTYFTPWVIPGGGAPHIVITPTNAASQALGLYISGMSPTGFNISSAGTPAATQSNSTYSVNFISFG